MNIEKVKISELEEVLWVDWVGWISGQVQEILNHMELSHNRIQIFQNMVFYPMIKLKIQMLSEAKDTRLKVLIRTYKWQLICKFITKILMSYMEIRDTSAKDRCIAKIFQDKVELAYNQFLNTTIIIIIWCQRLLVLA